MEVKIDEAKKLIKLYVDKKRPFFLEGAPGIGKSQIFRQVAKDKAKELSLEYEECMVNIKVNYDTKTASISMNKEYKNPEKYFFFLDVRISSLDPSDIRGIPFPEGMNVTWLTPNWLPNMGSGIIFADEINMAAPSIQASFYQLILDRKVGDYALPDNWCIMSAGNGEQDGCPVYPMGNALNNRFSHARLIPPSSESWTEWAIENNKSMDIISFINFKPTLLFKIEKNNKERAFPTPRTITLASDMIEGVKDQNFIHQIVASCVGEGFATEFSAFLKLKNKININDILANPKKVLDITEPGLLHTLMGGLAEKYKSQEKPADRKKMMDKILIVIGQKDFNEDFGVLLLKLMKMFDKNNFGKDLIASSEWSKISSKYTRFLL